MKYLTKKNLSCATEKIAKRQAAAPFPPSKRWGRQVVLIFFIVAAVMWCWKKISDPATYPIRSVKIVDTGFQADHQALRDAVFPSIKEGMLWLNEKNLEDVLIHIPWVSKVNLKRAWPDEIVVSILEQHPVAHWDTSDLLNQEGEVFNPGKVAYVGEPLPWFSGPVDQQKEVWAADQAMTQLLAPLGLKINGMLLTNRQSWKIVLSNGMLLLLGHDAVMLRLKRFVAVYPKLFLNRERQLDYVDLRYSSGFAVKWKNNLSGNSLSLQK